MSIAIVDQTDAEAGWGTISYNGFTFNGFRRFSLTAEDIYDDAGRTIICTEYRLTVQSFIVSNTAADSSAGMLPLRQQLEEPGQTLILKNVGLGDIQVNGEGANYQDIEWGPKPKILSWPKHHGVIAYEITWECTFRIREGNLTGSLAAFNYGVNYSIDDAGLTTRTVAGYLQIPLTRQNGQKFVTTSADAFRDQWINFPVPLGFARLQQEYQLSTDRTRENFAIVDRQLDNPGEAPPPNVLKADLMFDIANAAPGFSAWTATLAGSIEVPAGTDPGAAAAAFVTIAIDRWNNLNSIVQVGSGQLAVPFAMSFGRKMFSRVSNFSMQWTVVSCLSDILAQGGVWKPVTGSDVPSWAASMQTAWGARGQAGLYYNADNDAIVDLLDPPGISNYAAWVNQNLFMPSGSAAFNVVNNLNEDQSWLAYLNGIRIHRTRKASLHKPAVAYTPSNSAGSNLSQPSTQLPPVQAPLVDVMQDSSTPTETCLMQGKALRVGFTPALPDLVAVGGVPVEETRRVVDGPYPIACLFGVSVYSLAWSIEYRPTGGYFGSTSSLAEVNPTLCCETNPAPY